MKVYINRYHKFLEDYDSRIEKEYGSLRMLSYQTNLQHLKEWYGYDVEVDGNGLEAWVEMSEQNYTLFAIKYS